MPKKTVTDELTLQLDEFKKSGMSGTEMAGFLRIQHKLRPDILEGPQEEEPKKSRKTPATSSKNGSGKQEKPEPQTRTAGATN